MHEWTFDDGDSIIVLSEGRLMNLGNATGHPIVRHVQLVLEPDDRPDRAVHEDRASTSTRRALKVETLPKHLDEKVAQLHLDALGVELTELTKEQAEYLGVDVAGPVQAGALPLLTRTWNGADMDGRRRSRRSTEQSCCNATPVCSGSRPVPSPYASRTRGDRG